MIKSILLRKTVWLIIFVLAATWFIAGVELPGTTDMLASSYQGPVYEVSYPVLGP